MNYYLLYLYSWELFHGLPDRGATHTGTPYSYQKKYSKCYTTVRNTFFGKVLTTGF